MALFTSSIKIRLNVFPLNPPQALEIGDIDPNWGTVGPPDHRPRDRLHSAVTDQSLPPYMLDSPSSYEIELRTQDDALTRFVVLR